MAAPLTWWHDALLRVRLDPGRQARERYVAVNVGAGRRDEVEQTLNRTRVMQDDREGLLLAVAESAEAHDVGREGRPEGPSNTPELDRVPRED